MAPVFRVLRCYQCLVFQVHQAKRANKWECKLCGEKQSFKRQYGIGSAKDCRLQVQKLNILRGEVKETIESIICDDDTEDEDLPRPKPKKAFKSKWKSYVNDVEYQTKEETVNKENYFGDAEVVLEIPKKKSKKCKWKPPTTYSRVEKELIENSIGYTDENSYQNSVETDKTYWETKIEEAKKDDQIIPIKHNAQAFITSTVSEKVNVETVSSVNKNSKWAQYVREDDDSQSLSLLDTTNTLETKKNDPIPTMKCSTGNMFSLNDDIDLDDFLDF